MYASLDKSKKSCSGARFGPRKNSSFSKSIRKHEKLKIIRE
jgi:hypothetical protein